MLAAAAFSPTTHGAGAGRVAVLLRGETFRAHARQAYREVGADGYASQHAAALSHIQHVFEPLIQQLHYSAVDVYLETYNTTWLPDLLSWYGAYLSNNGKRRVRIHDTAAAGWDAGAVVGGLGPLDAPSGLARRVLAKQAHDALLLLRPDVILKPLFGCALASAVVDEGHAQMRILFPFRTWKIYDTLPGSLDRVADGLVWLPARTFNALLQTPGLLNALWLNHDALAAAVPAFGDEGVGYLLPGEQHDRCAACMHARVHAREC
jgi:hypothetical protein